MTCHRTPSCARRPCPAVLGYLDGDEADLTINMAGLQAQLTAREIGGQDEDMLLIPRPGEGTLPACGRVGRRLPRIAATATGEGRAAEAVTR